MAARVYGGSSPKGDPDGINSDKTSDSLHGSQPLSKEGAAYDGDGWIMVDRQKGFNNQSGHVQYANKTQNYIQGNFNAPSAPKLNPQPAELKRQTTWRFACGSTAATWKDVCTRVENWKKTVS